MYIVRIKLNHEQLGYVANAPSQKILTKDLAEARKFRNAINAHEHIRAVEHMLGVLGFCVFDVEMQNVS